MKTYLPNKNDIKRKKYLIDANDFVLGRLATRVADILKGKHRPEFTPHIDTGDYVVVINAERVRVTGSKLDNKKYAKTTGYIGNLKVTSLKEMLKNKPEEVIRKAVSGMLADNRLKKEILKRLEIYSGKNKPENIDKLKKIEYGK
jgi:large subunit ribosomal protein L13